MTLAMDYPTEKAWRGLSCYRGGGYRAGHGIGCECAIAEGNLTQLASDRASRN